MGNLHFTYVEPNHDELLQGDILRRSPELDAVIREVHPHYLKKEYTHFQVITQSCDLALHDGHCKARYITIAAVRSLETVITRELEKIIKKGHAVVIDGVVHCSRFVRADLQSFLKKIYNNQSKDYFYLNAAPLFKLETDSCTFLPLSIAIKADLHFHTCLKSKILQLEDNFQSRLGWMVGNLYSRVGTKDFVPTAKPTAEEFSQLVNEKLLNHLSWVKEDEFRYYRQSSTEQNANLEVVKQKISEGTNNKIKTGVNEIIKILKMEIDIDPEKEKSLVNRLSGNGLLVSRFTKSGASSD